MDGGESYKEVTEGNLSQIPLHLLTKHTSGYFTNRERERERGGEGDFCLTTLSIPKVILLK